MSRVACQISMSLDGYVAGPNQSRENPLAEGGMHEREPLEPVLLGSGAPRFDGAADVQLEPLEAIHSPLATHVRYRVAG